MFDLDHWEEIAKSLGAISSSGEIGSSHLANEALELILGKDNLQQAVHYYIQQKPGSELLRHLLWQIRPFSAMEECYKVFVTSNDVEDKITAVELLRVIADNRALPWVKEFLTSDIEGVQNWGIGIIDQLLFSRLCNHEDVSDILRDAVKHNNEYVRKQAKEILLNL